MTSCQGWVLLRGMPMPCDSCYMAAELPLLGRRHVPDLHRYRSLVALRAGGITHLEERPIGDVIADADDVLRRRWGIGSIQRDQWCAWLDAHDAPAGRVTAA